MSDGSGSSDDDGDYALETSATESSLRYPVHDCCEFEDAETLRVSSAIWSIVVLPVLRCCLSNTALLAAQDRARRRTSQKELEVKFELPWNNNTVINKHAIITTAQLTFLLTCCAFILATASHTSSC
jgi:hypothetical protein